MAQGESAVALLHMSAVVWVLSIAYLGLDRLDRGEDWLSGCITNAETEAVSVIASLGVGSSGLSIRNWRAIPVYMPACVICVLAKRNVAMGPFSAVCFFFYRQAHIPLFVFFRDKKYMAHASIYGVFSTLIFLATCFGTVFQMHYVDEPLYLAVCFWPLTYIALWVVITGALALRLKSATGICERLRALYERRKLGYDTEARKRARRENDRIDRQLEKLKQKQARLEQRRVGQQVTQEDSVAQASGAPRPDPSAVESDVPQDSKSGGA